MSTQDHEPLHISDEDIERIAAKVYDKLFADIGRSVVRKLLFPLLVGAMGVWVYLGSGLKWPGKS